MGGPFKPKSKPAPTPKAEEQPKVEAQMDAPKDEQVEMDNKMLETKKKGRRSTILTSAGGLDEQVKLGYKTLLG